LCPINSPSGKVKELHSAFSAKFYRFVQFAQLSEGTQNKWICRKRGFRSGRKDVEGFTSFVKFKTFKKEDGVELKSGLCWHSGGRTP
jgi:hypothetical protein